MAKFEEVSKNIGSAMMSVVGASVMGIGLDVPSWKNI
jgi:hypothetical protein